MKKLSMSGPMALAILEGRKTVTRRKVQKSGKPRFVPGEIVYMAEAHWRGPQPRRVEYDAGFDQAARDAASTWSAKLVPAHLMPEWASRQKLEIVSCRFETLGDITDEEAKLEGFENRNEFLHYWGAVIYDSYDPDQTIERIEFKKVGLGEEVEA